ncbi:hypothetical protein EK904_004763 [Melospiza melodia maxima]|nr:hypothetical protein EK904_004763 [Melospiza melodia maxima]
MGAGAVNYVEADQIGLRNAVGYFLTPLPFPQNQTGDRMSPGLTSHECCRIAEAETVTHKEAKHQAAQGSSQTARQGRGSRKVHTAFQRDLSPVFLLSQGEHPVTERMKLMNVHYEYCILQLQVFEQKAGEGEVHMGEMWTTRRCPRAATRHQTLAFSADMPYFLSMTDVGTAFKGKPRCIHSPLIERLRIKPSLSRFNFNY